MTLTPFTPDKEEKEAEVLPFIHPVPGSGGSDGDDWLSPIPAGSNFLCRAKGLEVSKKPQGHPFLLTMYKVLWCGKRARQLLVYVNQFDGRPDDTIVICVDPVAFCREYALFEEMEPVSDSD